MDIGDLGLTVIVKQIILVEEVYYSFVYQGTKSQTILKSGLCETDIIFEKLAFIKLS